MGEFDDRTILVTGATGGVGPTVTDRFVDRGADVVGTYHRDRDELREARERAERVDEVHYYDVDLSRRNAVRGMRDDLLDRYGEVDGVVNLVGGYSSGTIEETDAEQLDTELERQVRTVFLVLKSFRESLEESGGAAVNFTSRRALDSEAGALAYNVGKVGVKSMTECVAEECRSARVNAVAPTILDTPANREAMPEADFDEWTSPRELADVLEYMLSEGSRPVSGETIAV